jgi:hypothetical protein
MAEKGRPASPGRRHFLDQRNLPKSRAFLVKFGEFSPVTPVLLTFRRMLDVESPAPLRAGLSVL